MKTSSLTRRNLLRGAAGALVVARATRAVFAKDDVRQNFLTPKRLEEVLARVDEAKSIIGGTARSLAEGALRFILADDAVSTVIPGAKNVRQIEMNIADWAMMPGARKSM